MDVLRPLFSVVTAVYNVEPYLRDFIASIEGQRFDLQRVEVIAVDDGSTDGSLAVLQDWARRSHGLVKVATKPNGGQSSARNLGLEHATGEWVTFTDPDDMLDANFFTVAQRFAMAHPDVEVLAGKPISLLENSGRLSDHSRWQQYEAGNRRVDLEHEPNTFVGTGAASLFKLDRIRALGLRYDPRVRPKFEDIHFAVHYLMGLPAPVVGVLRDAKYIYRRRATNDSALQQSWSHPGTYSDVLEFGHLEVLERARARYGRVPPWLQHVIIYDLSWFLEADEDPRSIRIAPALIPRFHELFEQIVRYLEPEVVWSHTVRPLKSVWADLFAHAGRLEDWHSAVAVRTKVDLQMGLQRIGYRYVGARPREEFLIDGAAVPPAFSKTMSHRYLGKTLMNERIVWLPSGLTSRVLLDGASVAIVTKWPEPRQPARSTSIRERLWRYRRLPAAYLAKALARRGRAALGSSLGLLQRHPMRLLARALPYRSRFSAAWVLMDRMDAAGDNGERLFEYLLAERPDINAWFVLEKRSPDWKRMRAAGVRRLVAYGSLQWKMLMLNCAWVLSSHGDDGIIKPEQITRISGQPTWKFASLQHGAIKDDLSAWLNKLDSDLFVLGTPAELESVVADGTSYRYSAKEARNTGLPRWDRLLAKGRQFSPEDRDLILVAPTWRMWLSLPLVLASERRQAEEAFWKSEYFRSWNALLRSPRIAAAAARQGRRVAFMPHPDMQAILARMKLPAHIRLFAYAGNDVQELFARCALLVTDYSSVAFDAAYLNCPLVYFQFDREQFMSGGHPGRPYYYEYPRDGFGPVVIDVAEAETAIVAAIDNGPSPAPEYQARIDQTFPNRDGRACARVVAAIEELSRPYVPPTTT